MGDRAFAFSSLILVGIVLLAIGVIFTVSLSYQGSKNDACLGLGDILSVVDSKYSCYDAGSGQSALSLLFKKQVEGVQVTFIDAQGKRSVQIVKGSSSSDIRGLNGQFNQPVSYADDGIETFVYGGGAARSVEVAPVINGNVCGVSDSRTLDPCTPEALSSMSLGENSNKQESHLECLNNACTRVAGSGSNACTVEGAFCGSRGGGSGGGGGSSGSSGGNTGNSGNQVPIAYFTSNVTSGDVPLNVLFNATLSYDPDGTIVSYIWNFGDGNVTTVSSPLIVHTYVVEGLYDVVLTVTDNDGATDNENGTIDTSSSSGSSLCGNGVIDLIEGETCDDTNTFIGDGCSDTCQIETFTIDIESPSDGASLNYNTSISLNVSVIDSSGTLALCKYSLDNKPNVTMPGCNLVTFDTSEGSHIIQVYASTSAGRNVSDTASFSVNLNAPAVTLISPNDGLQTNAQPVVFSYIPSDSSLQSCSIWGNFSGTYGLVQTSSSVVSDSTNTFSSSVAEGTYKWAVSCSDTLGSSTITANRTLIVDRTAPQFSSFNESPADNSAYSFATAYYFNSTITGNPQTVLVLLDSKLFVASSLGSGVFGIGSSSLAVGSHTVQWTVNDSANNINQVFRNYDVARAAPSGTLTASSWNVAYPNSAIISYAEPNFGDADLTYSITRDGVSRPLSEIVSLPAGTYNYQLAQTTLGQNYTAATLDSHQFVVSQGASTATLVLTPSTPQIYGAGITASCSDTNPEANAVLYRDGIDVTSENNVAVALAAGDYIYECIVASTQNYSGATSGQGLYQISKAAGDVHAFVNNSRSDLVVPIGSQVVLNATLFAGQGPIVLEFNGSVINQGYTSIQNLTIINTAGVYNITARYLGNTNYTSDAETWFLTVLANQAPVANFTANPETGNAPLAVFFNATNPYDPDGTIVSYSWDFGDFQSGSGQTINHIYSSGIAATYIAILTVTDNNGVTNSTSLPITTTSSSDTTAPTFGSLTVSPVSPQTFNTGKTYTFNATCTDNVAVSTVILILNGANYTASKVGATNVYTKSFTTLGSDGGSGYTWRFWCNDTSGNSRLSNPTVAYTVNRNNTNCSIISNGPVTYPSALTVSGSCTSTDVSAKLYNNASGDVSSKNGVATVWASGNYNFTVNVTQTQNYTAASRSLVATVIKGTGDVDARVNNQRSDISIQAGTTIPLNATLAAGVGIVQLELNGAVIASAQNSVQVSQLFSNVGLYNITARYLGNTNYTSDAETWFVTVSAGSPNNLVANIIIREADWIVERKASGAPLNSRYLGTNQTDYYAPLPVFFEGWNSTRRDSIVNYSWDFGDGSHQNYGFNAAHVYETPGTYTARLTVADNAGMTNSTTVTINVRSPDGITYYVDSQIGSDSCNGKSSTVIDSNNCPWETATKAFEGFKNNFYQPGDQVLFNRGQTFLANVSQNGNSHWTSGWGYSFGAYGTGAKPVIKPTGAPNPNGNYTLSFGGVGLAYISFKDLRFDCTSSTGVKTVCYSNNAQNQNILFLRDDFINSEQSLLSAGIGPNQSDIFIIDSNFYNSSVVHTFIQSKRAAIINNHIEFAGNHLNYWPYLDKAVIINNIFTRPAFGRTALRIDGDWSIYNQFDGPSDNVYVGYNFLGGWVDPIDGSNCGGCDPLGAHNGGGNSFNYNLINIAPNAPTGQSIENIMFENNIATESQTFMSIGDSVNVTVRSNVFRTIDDSTAGRIGIGSTFDCRPSQNVNVANNTIIVNSNNSNAYVVNNQLYFGTIFWSGNFTAHLGCGIYQYPSQTSHENLAYENNSIIQLTVPRTMITYGTFNNTQLPANELYKLYNLSLRNNKLYSTSDQNATYYNGTYYNIAQWNSMFGTAAGTTLNTPQAYISPGLVISPIFQDGGNIHLWFDYIKAFNGVNVQQIKLLVKKDNGVWEDSGLSSTGLPGTYGLQGTFDYIPTQGDGDYYFALQVVGNDLNLYPSHIDLPMTRTVYTSGSYALNTCNNGLDDNDDGLVDWVGGDMDCANSSDSEGNTPSGMLKNNWTVYHPSVDSRIVYVSQSTGNDAWDGFAAEFNGTSGPKKSIAAGKLAIRNQGDWPYNAPKYADWLLLKRGDVWNETLGEWAASGPSDTQRVVVSSYGSSTERPLMVLPGFDGVGFNNYFRVAEMDNVAIIGLAFKPHPQYGGFGGSFGVSILGNVVNLTFEGNSFTGFQSNMIIQTGITDGIRNVKIRNNVIADTVSLEDVMGHSQGIITGNIRDLLIEGNIMDNNGYLPLPFPYMSADYPDQNLANWTGISAGKFDLLFVRYNYTSGLNEYLNVPVSNVNLVGSTSLADIASRLQTAANSAAQPANTVNIQSYVYPYKNLTYFLFNSTDNLSPSNYAWGMYGFGPYTGGFSGGTDLVELNASKPSLFNSCKTFTLDYISINRTICGSWMQRNVFSQNMYITIYNKNVTVRGNIISRPGHNGLQLRNGGVTEGNLFIRNPLAMFSGGVEPVSITRNNVVLEGIDLDITQAGARAYGIDAQESANVTVENNIVANTNSAWSYGAAYSISGVGEGATNLNYRALLRNNIAYNWRGAGLSLNYGHPDGGAYQSVFINVTNNFFQEPTSGILVYANNQTLENLGAVKFSGNTYYSASPIWFGIYGFNSDYSQWLAASAEVGSQQQQIAYNDPDRSVAEYNSLQGGMATYDSFMEEARKQSRVNWRDEYTAAAVNKYISDGFSVGGGCGPIGCSPLTNPNGGENISWLDKILAFFKGRLAGHVVSNTEQVPELVPLVGRSIDSSYKNSYDQTHVFWALVLLFIAIFVMYILKSKNRKRSKR